MIAEPSGTLTEETKHEETHEKLMLIMYQLPVLMDFGSQLLGPSPPIQSTISGGKMLVIYGDNMVIYGDNMLIYGDIW